MKKNLILLALVSLSFLSCKEDADKSSEVVVVDSSMIQSDENVDANNEVVLSNSTWRLVKLNGKAIEKNKDEERELGIIFTNDGRFSAYAGCNNMMGEYELKEAESQIKFSKVGMTMMACPDDSLEKEFAEVLEMADNYNFDGKTFKLNKARMAPIAEFEIIK